MVRVKIWIAGIAVVALGCRAHPHSGTPAAVMTPTPVAVAPAEEPTRTAPDPAELGFLAHLRPEHDAIAYLDEPMLRVQMLLQSDSIRRIVAEPSIAKAKPELAAGLDKAVAAIERDISRWPRSIAVGSSGTVGVQFVRLLRTVLAWQMLQSPARDDPAARALVAELRDDIAADLELLTIPSTVVWMQMASDAAAELLLDNTHTIATASVPQLVTRDSNRSITISFAVAQAVDRDALISIVRTLGLADDVSTPTAQRMLDALARLEVVLHVVRHGDALVYELSSQRLQPPASPRRVDQLGELFDARSSAMALWGRWDFVAMRDAVAETVAAIDRRRASVMGRQLLLADAEGIAGAFDTMKWALDLQPVRAEFRLSSGDGLEFERITDRPRAAAPIVAGEILRLVPPATVYVSLDTTVDLASWLALTLTAIEDRLAGKSLAAMVGGDAAKRTAAEERESSFSSAVAGLRPLLRRGEQVFEPPLAVLVVDPETPARLGLRASPTDEVAVPVPEFAVIGRPKRRADADKWIAATIREFVVALTTLTHRPAPKGSIVATADLGLGVATHAVDLQALAVWAPSGTHMFADPGLVLHWFEHRGFLVVSTSTRLSREILGLQESALEVAGDAVIHAEFSGERAAEHLAKMAEAGARFGPLAQALAMASRIVRPTRLRIYARDVGDQRRTTITLGLAPAIASAPSTR